MATVSSAIPLRELKAVNHEIQQFEECSVTNPLDEKKGSLPSYLILMEKKRKRGFKIHSSSWVPVVSTEMEGNLLFSVDRRPRSGVVVSSTQFHHYIDFAFHLSDLDVITHAGRSTVKVTYKTIKTKSSSSHAIINSIKLRFENEDFASEWMSKVQSLAESAKGASQDHFVLRDSVVAKMKKMADIFEKAAQHLRSSNLEHILRSLYFSLQKDAFLRLCTYANAKKTQWFSANFDRLIEEIEVEEKTAMKARQRAKREHDMNVGCVLLDQLYRKTYVRPLARLLHNKYVSDTLPLEMRCHEFLESAVEQSLDMFGRHVSGTRGLAMGHMLQGLFVNRLNASLIRLKNNSYNHKNRELVLITMMKSQLNWLHGKESTSSASALRRWRKSASVAQIQCNGIHKLLKERMMKNTSGVTQRWFRWSRRLCDLDKSGWHKIENVINMVQINSKAFAFARFSAHCRVTEVAENYQVLHNLSLVNDVLEQTFDAAPLERGCYMLGGVLHRRLSALKVLSISRLRHHCARKVMAGIGAQLGTVQLQDFFNRYLLKHLLFMANRDLTTLCRDTMSIQQMSFTTKKLACHRLTRLLVTSVNLECIQPVFRLLQPSEPIVRIVNRQGHKEGSISKKMHNRKLMELGLLRLQRCFPRLVESGLLLAWDELRFKDSNSRYFKIDWDAEYRSNAIQSESLMLKNSPMEWSMLMDIADDTRGDNKESIFFEEPRDDSVQYRRDEVLGFTSVSLYMSKRGIPPSMRMSEKWRTLPKVYAYIQSTVPPCGFEDPSDSSTVHSSEISSLFSEIDKSHYRPSPQPPLPPIQSKKMGDLMKNWTRQSPRQSPHPPVTSPFIQNIFLPLLRSDKESSTGGSDL
eukprot:GHVH01000889.1.p1 GENE.GHVH01000889.1~~GHVH01000889.1.p1  ORF type:complete len:874 (+),score=102.10 GHVH01000889.1:37-2622(+)